MVDSSAVQLRVIGCKVTCEIKQCLKVVAQFPWFSRMIKCRLEWVLRVLCVGWDSTRRGLNRAFKKLYNLKNFNKTIYLKFKTQIAEAIMLVYKTVQFNIKQKYILFQIKFKPKRTYVIKSNSKIRDRKMTHEIFIGSAKPLAYFQSPTLC